MLSTGRPQVGCRLVGQLGNQLFTYFAGLSIARPQEERVWVSAFFATRTDGEISIRHCALPGFGGVRADSRIVSTVLGASRREGFHTRLSTTIQRFQGRSIYRSPVIGYPGPLAFLKGVNVVLDGYFQCSLYVEEVRRRLGLDRAEMVKEISRSAWLENLRKRARDVAPIGVHIRAAQDYRRAGLNLNTAQYISSALEMVDDSDAHRPIWVFTDDERYARNVFPRQFISRVEFMTAPVKSKPVHVMLGLASADCLVIANSTFSWWSAYLSGHDRVVIPEPWMPSGEMSERSFIANLALPGWRTVQVSG